MIRFDMLWAIARAEMRLTRRLVRYWVFLALAFLMGMAIFGWYTWIHWGVSAFSATAAAINPRFLATYIGLWYLLTFLGGLIFLGFDVRARDRRERMFEVLDALPCSNLELVLGKYLGIVIVSWIPVVVISVCMALLGWFVGSPLQLATLVTFSVFMAIPAFSFVIGLVFFLTLLLRHRGLAALALIVVLVALVSVNMAFVPIYMMSLPDVTGAFAVDWPSDFSPTIVSGVGLVQRAGYFLFGLGFLWLAAAIHPRRDDASRGTRAAVGAGLLVLGAALLLAQVFQNRGFVQQREAWREAHAAENERPLPDIKSLRGDVRIDPGRALAMNLTLEIRAPGEDLERALFSLNPGLEVEAVRDETGSVLEARSWDGMVEVTLAERMPAGSTRSLEMQIRGTLDPRFAYIDAAFDPLSLNIREGNIFLLGYDPFLFQKRSVVLMPGARWLPAAGPEVGRGDVRQRPVDFFEVDLTIDLPEGWLVAGPGRREDAPGADSGRQRFRIHPTAPVPDVALMAARYSSRTTEINGVRFEVLVHEKHQANFEVLADATGELRDWLDERMQDAADAGLPYPYDSLTMVEIPGRVRSYGGGWRMDSTFTQPAMVLMREAGFPTARFDTMFSDPDDFKDKEGGMPVAMREALERFFETDFTGGNPFIAAGRSFFGFQTGGRGVEGLPLDHVYQDLATRLVSDKQGYFSVHHFGADFGEISNQAITAVFTSRSDDMAEVIIDAVTDRIEVWDKVLGVSLADIDPWEDPKLTVDVLTVKGGAMARSMLDGMGREKSGKFLGALRERTSGEGYTREDVLEAGNVVDEDLESWLDTWIRQTELPGFILGPIELVRITDDDNGQPRYQTSVTVRNEEVTPGLIQLEYSVGERQRRTPRETTEPIRVQGASALQINLVTAKPPRRLRVVPYLSLNRGSFSVPLPAVDEEKIVEREPATDEREVAWEPSPTRSITVDDLDEGFSVQESEGRSLWRFAGKGVDAPTDQGLPVMVNFRPPSRWSRRESVDAWGKYRHTLAIVRGGEGERRATFATEIPRAGRWRLECHVPEWVLRAAGRRGGKPRVGDWHLDVIDDSGERTVDFDAASGESGWNELGEFDLASGQVRVELSDESEGRIVIADAIRWTPVSSAGVASSAGAASGAAP